MRPVERDPALLWDMLSAARDIHSLIADVNLAEFVENKLLKLGIERCFSIIGEAASRISTETRPAFPQVPWKAIIGKRNIIVHDYYELDYERIYLAATVDVPELIANLEKILPDID